MFVKTILLKIFIILCIVLLFTSCVPIETGKGNKAFMDSEHSQEVKNLEKLCLVWGYSKYRHPVFYTGEKDWDEGLHALLIPQVPRKQRVIKRPTRFCMTGLYLWVRQILEKLEIIGLGKIWTLIKSSLQADISWSKDNQYLREKLFHKPAESVKYFQQ